MPEEKTGYSANPDFESVDTEQATLTEKIEHQNEPLTLFVRTNGDDSNTGLSSSEAKKTIDGVLSALTRISLGTNLGADNTATLKIDLEDGATFSVSNRHFIYAPHLIVEFVGDSASPPTIDCTRSGTNLIVQNTKTVWSDVTVTSVASDAKPVRLELGARAGFEGCSLDASTNGADRIVEAFHGSHVELDSSTSVTGDGSGGSTTGVFAHSSSHITNNADVSACNIGISGDQGATADLLGGTIEDNNIAVKTEDGAVFKTTGGTVQNNTTMLQSRRGAQNRISSGPTITGNTTQYDVTGSAMIERADGLWSFGWQEVLTNWEDVNDNTDPQVEVTNLARSNEVEYHIYVRQFESNNNTGDATLELEVTGLSNGSYDDINSDVQQLTEDETGANTNTGSNNQWDLIETTASSGGDDHTGHWVLRIISARPSVFGNGAPGARKQGKYVVRGGTETTLEDPFDLRLTANGSSVNVKVTVYKVRTNVVD